MGRKPQRNDVQKWAWVELNYLAEEFEPSGQALRNWVKQADLDQGVRSDGLTTAEREELQQLRREIKQLNMEREIPKKAAAWFAREKRVDSRVGFEFVKANQAEFPVRLMCRTLGLSTRMRPYPPLESKASTRPRKRDNPESACASSAPSSRVRQTHDRYAKAFESRVAQDLVARK